MCYGAESNVAVKAAPAVSDLPTGTSVQVFLEEWDGSKYDGPILYVATKDGVRWVDLSEESNKSYEYTTVSSLVAADKLTELSTYAPLVEDTEPLTVDEFDAAVADIFEEAGIKNEKDLTLVRGVAGAGLNQVMNSYKLVGHILGDVDHQRVGNAIAEVIFLAVESQLEGYFKASSRQGLLNALGR